MQINWKNCFRIGVSAFVLFLAIHYWEVFVSVIRMGLHAARPLVLGAILAYLVNILMSFLEEKAEWIGKIKFPKRKKQRQKEQKSKKDLTKGSRVNWRRPICLILSYVLILLLIWAIFSLAVPELVNAIKVLVLGVPDAIKNLMKQELVVTYLPEVTGYLEGVNWEETVKQTVELFTSNVNLIANGTISVVSAVMSRSIDFLVAFIFSFYILFGKERLCAGLKRVTHHYLPDKAVTIAGHILQVLHKNFHNFIVGQCMEAVILGALCAVGMLLFRFPYAVMVGILVGATAVIPVAGAYIGAGVGAFLILTVSPLQAVFFLIFIVVLQQLEGNLIYPRVVGSSIGLPAIWVLAAITLGGGIAGVLGMLIGVPLFASAYQLLKENMEKPSGRQKIGPEKE